MDFSQISVGVIDDDINFCEIMVYFLKKIGINHIETAHTINEGKVLLDSKALDLVLLGIDFGPGENGVDLGNYIRQSNTDLKIIFFTNNFNDEIYEAAKSAKPNAFLDKELSELKVRQSVELAFIQEKEAFVHLTPSQHGCFFAKEFVFVKVGSVFKKILLDDIDYIVYSERYANLVLDGKLFPINMTMKDLAKKLPGNKFIQIHQSYIVNLEKITMINTTENKAEVVGKSIPIGVSFRKPFYERLSFLT